MEMERGPAQPPLVCGIPQSLVERFLFLVRDGYPKAELATGFLEERAGIKNVQGIANVRDTLSHLATFLDPAIDNEEREKQIVSAEEHLRRAIIEPYQIAIEDFVAKKFEPLYENYKTRLLPVSDRYASLRSAPNAVQVEAILRDIQDHSLRARIAKGRNRWDQEWEVGISHFVRAFDKLTDLQAQLEDYWNKFEQARIDRHHTRLHIWGIVATVIIGILGIAVAYLLYRLTVHP